MPAAKRGEEFRARCQATGGPAGSLPSEVSLASGTKNRACVDGASAIGPRQAVRGRG